MEDVLNQTIGERRVRASFNPSGDNKVDDIKAKTASLIDLLQVAKADEVSKTYDKSPEDK